MTPPATVAGRRRATGTRPARAGGSARGRPPRRVSGPARPAPSGGRLAAAAAAALPLPATRPSAPPRQRPRAVPRPARRSDLPLGARALAWLRALPDHRLLDRLIGGRIWIVLLGTLLVGIVTVQLSLLRLNAGIGRAVERSSALEQRNAALRLQNSQLSNSESIIAQATQMGFVTPPQGSPRFLSANAADAGKALTTMRVPDPAAFAAATAAETTTTDPSATTDTTATPVDTTATDATGTAPVATTAPGTTVTTAPATATTPPATGTTAPVTGTTAPVTPSTPVAGGASAPPTQGVGGQG